MKSDARFLLNKKKWKNTKNSRKVEQFKTPEYKSRGSLDARKILNLKRNQQKKAPQLGGFMRTKIAAEFIASQIRKEIKPASKNPLKKVQLSKDGNIIITSKSKNSAQAPLRRGILQKMDVDMPSSSRFLQALTVKQRMQSPDLDNLKRTALDGWLTNPPSFATARPALSVKQRVQSPDLDDLEHTALEDLLDLETLPPSFASARSFPVANLSRQQPKNSVLESRTMVADQLAAQQVKDTCAKVYVSNLHPSVSQEDLMELFGDVGLIKAAEMLMPGTAIIDFFSAEDAERACEIYHNRLLDGLPMKCYLQTQKVQPLKSAISQRLGNRIIAPPSPTTAVSLPSSANTTNPRSRYNPRNVQFTVKLA